MWMMGRKIVGAVLLMFVVFVGMASAQYNSYPTTPAPAQPPSQSSTPRAVSAVSTAMVTVQGKQEKILIDGKGMSLYYFAADTLTKAACTGGCASLWPPLLSTSAPTSANPLPGKLTVAQTTNGSQVAYNGHLLYRYSLDKAAGQTNGQGVAGKWQVASVNLKPVTSLAPGPVTSSGGSTKSNTGW